MKYMQYEKSKLYYQQPQFPKIIVSQRLDQKCATDKVFIKSKLFTERDLGHGTAVIYMTLQHSY